MRQSTRRSGIGQTEREWGSEFVVTHAAGRMGFTATNVTPRQAVVGVTRIEKIFSSGGNQFGGWYFTR